ncbi:MAG: tetratricopeptide repeat protein [Sphingobacteriaceae bacterium]|nr:tetratricopeptide repeat protein [Sphingobacteriaceae bacterium]
MRKASALEKIGKNKEALEILNKGEAFLIGTKFKSYLAEFKIRKAYIELAEKKYEEAIHSFKEADSLYALTKYYTGSAECNQTIGRIYALQIDYPKAITYCQKAIQLAELSKDPRSIGNCYLVLGNTFMQQQNYDKSLECYLKMLEYFKDSKNEYVIAGAYICIGNYYLYTKDFPKAKENYIQCLELREKIQDQLGIAYVIQNLGEVERAMGNLEGASKYYRQGLVSAEKLKDPLLLTGTLNNLASIEIDRKNFASAENYGLQALQLSERYGLKEFELHSKSALAKALFGAGKYREAYIYKDSVMMLKDSLTDQRQAAMALELEGKFQNHKKESEIKLQKLSLDKKDTELDASKKQRVIIIAVLILVLVFLAVLFNRFKITNKQKAIITSQKAEVEQQRNEIQEKQNEILDSLQYAKQIQKLLLANHKLVNETLPDSFIVFKPKDIVSGDFYWAAKKEDRFYLAVCDSTGHGVPGAFMSLLNINFLNEAIIEKNIKEPNEVFNYVRKRLVDNLSQDGRQDGMDGILICVKDQKITYAASNNAPFIIKNNTLSILDADKMPIGKGEKNEPFKLYEFEMNKGDQLYLSTDGFADQFGGPKGKKYKYKPMYDLILKNCNLPVLQQEELLFAEFETWRGQLEQVDDVCILGIRL